MHSNTVPYFNHYIHTTDTSKMLAFLQKITNTKGHVLYLCCAHIRFVTGTA